MLRTCCGGLGLIGKRVSREWQDPERRKIRVDESVFDTFGLYVETARKA